MCVCLCVFHEWRTKRALLCIHIHFITWTRGVCSEGLSLRARCLHVRGGLWVVWCHSCHRGLRPNVTRHRFATFPLEDFCQKTRASESLSKPTSAMPPLHLVPFVEDRYEIEDHPPARDREEIYSVSSGWATYSQDVPCEGGALRLVV